MSPIPRKLRPFIALLFSVMGAGLLGCGGGGKSGDGAAAAPAKDTILIGHFGSMTGSEATFGQSTDNGIRLAMKEANAAGGVLGKKIELKTYDDQGKGQEAGTAVTRLITSDHVVAVLGEVASSLSIAGGRVAQQYGVPMISPSSTNPQVTEIGDMVFRVCFLDPFQGWVAAKFARENLKATKAAILYDQAQAYSKGLMDAFDKAFKEMGGTITTVQAYTGGDQDFSAQLTTMRQTNPEVIFVPGYYTDAGNISIQVRKLGLTAPMLGGDGWDSVKLAEIGGPSIEGSYFTNHYSHQNPAPQVQNFVSKYKAEYGQIPDGLAALGYDAARLLFDAMSRAGALDGKILAAAIAATKDFAGVTGTITIDAQRNAQKAAVVLVMKNGVPTYVTTIEPPK
jgi:branched-chain amino acid transport system substrate-binding protein